MLAIVRFAIRERAFLHSVFLSFFFLFLHVKTKSEKHAL